MNKMTEIKLRKFIATTIREYLNEQQKMYPYESVTDVNLEMIGPDVNELLDAINRLNGAQISGSAFKFRDNVKLNPIDKTGHVIAKNKFSIEVIPVAKNQPVPNENIYMREANLFLQKNGFQCQLYKTT